MGVSLKRIPFFADDIAIVPHTATDREHVNKRITIRSFADGQPVCLDRVMETDEYVVTRRDGAFIQGAEYHNYVVV